MWLHFQRVYCLHWCLLTPLMRRKSPHHKLLVRLIFVAEWDHRQAVHVGGMFVKAYTRSLYAPRYARTLLYWRLRLIAVRKKKKRKSRAKNKQRGCLHVYLKSRLSAAHTHSGKDIYVNCRWLYSPHCTCEWTMPHCTYFITLWVLIIFTPDKKQNPSI